VAPQDSQNCGRDFAKCKQTDAEFAGNSLLRMVIIDIRVITRMHGSALSCVRSDSRALFSKIVFCYFSGSERRVFVLSLKELIEMRALVLEVYLLQRSLFYRLFQM